MAGLISNTRTISSVHRACRTCQLASNLHPAFTAQPCSCMLADGEVHDITKTPTAESAQEGTGGARQELFPVYSYDHKVSVPCAPAPGDHVRLYAGAPNPPKRNPHALSASPWAEHPATSARSSKRWPCVAFRRAGCGRRPRQYRSAELCRKRGEARARRRGRTRRRRRRRPRARRRRAAAPAMT